MKKTTRLTALLIALVLLLANISASATETSGTTEDNGAFPVGDLDMTRYSTMLMTASEESGVLDITTCEGCPEYCKRVQYMLNTCQTAQERYDYLMSLYVPEGEEAADSEEDLILEYTLWHYYYCHVEDPEDFSTYDICVCSLPLSYPEYYKPGDLSAHTEPDCPWKFENLTLNEQFDIASKAESKDAYVEALNGDAANQKQLVYSLKAGSTEAMYLEGTELIFTGLGESVATYNPETGELIDAYLGVAVAKIDPETGKMVSLYSAN